jgi:hypothetical protein
MIIRGILDVSRMNLRKSKKPSLINCLNIRDTLSLHDFQITRNLWPESDHSFGSSPKISSKSALITIEIFNQTYFISFLVRSDHLSSYQPPDLCWWPSFRLPNFRTNFVSNDHNSTSRNRFNGWISK